MKIKQQLIQANFLKKLSFKSTPPPEVDYGSLELPENWEATLTNYLNDKDNALAKHIGNQSTYTHKAKLREAISVIFWRLNGDLDTQLGPLSADERAMIIACCSEDIQNCSPGFHNRINLAAAALSKPNNLAQLLHLVRENLVYKASAKATDDVHSTNRFTYIAYSEGLGINPNFGQDVYAGRLHDDDIRTDLKNIFAKEYHALRLPLLLTEQIRSLLAPLGYVGKKTAPDSYTYTIYDSIYNELKNFLPKLNMADTFKMDDDSHILGINWIHIQQSFYQRLTSRGYVETAIKPTTLLETALHLRWHQTDDATTQEILKKYINTFSITTNNNHASNTLLIEEYNALTHDVRAYKNIAGSLLVDIDPENLAMDDKTLKTLLCITAKYTPRLLHKLLKLETWRKKIWECFTRSRILFNELGDLCTFLTRYPDDIGIHFVGRILEAQDDRGWNNAMVCLGDPDSNLTINRQIIAFLLAHAKKLGKEAVADIITQPSSKGWNSFMIAAIRYPSLLPQLASLFVKCIKKNDIDTILKFTKQLSCDNRNIFLIALLKLDDGDMLNLLFRAISKVDANYIGIKNCAAFLRPDFIKALVRYQSGFLRLYFFAFHPFLEETNRVDALNNIDPLLVVDICPKLVFMHIFHKDNLTRLSNEELDQLAQPLLIEVEKNLQQTNQTSSRINPTLFGLRPSLIEKMQAHDALLNYVQHKDTNLPALMKLHRALNTGDLGRLAKALSKFSTADQALDQVEMRAIGALN